MKISVKKVLLSSCREIEPSSISDFASKFSKSRSSQRIITELSAMPAFENFEPKNTKNAAKVNAENECATII